MAEANSLISSSSRNINQIPNSFQSKLNSQKLQPHNLNNIRFKASSSKRYDSSSLIINKQDGRYNRRRLITISTADGKWHGTWNCDYLVSLKDLNLDDLVEADEQRDAEVSINLCIHKVDSMPALDFQWMERLLHLLPENVASVLPHIADRLIPTSTFGSWPRTETMMQLINCLKSVIYVKPGYEANLDSLIQDTIRLTTDTKDICSESCRKSEPTLRYIGKRNAASIDKRWSRLLELRNTNLI